MIGSYDFIEISSSKKAKPSLITAESNYTTSIIKFNDFSEKTFNSMHEPFSTIINRTAKYFFVQNVYQRSRSKSIDLSRLIRNPFNDGIVMEISRVWMNCRPNNWWNEKNVSDFDRKKIFSPYDRRRRSLSGKFWMDNTVNKRRDR